MSKDRAAPFSRKHRRYWITITGGMIFIGLLNVAIGLFSYTEAVTPTRIIPVLPPPTGGVPVAPPRAVPCPIGELIAQKLGPGTITACVAHGTDDYEVTDVRADGRVARLVLSHGTITQVDEVLTLDKIPTPVMHAFAVTYPRILPAQAVKRSRAGEPPTFVITFPPDKGHAHATLDEAGTVLGTD